MDAKKFQMIIKNILDDKYDKKIFKIYLPTYCNVHLGTSFKIIKQSVELIREPRAFHFTDDCIYFEKLLCKRALKKTNTVAGNYVSYDYLFARPDSVTSETVTMLPNCSFSKETEMILTEME